MISVQFENEEKTGLLKRFFCCVPRYLLSVGNKHGDAFMGLSDIYLLIMCSHSPP